jgi:hypothetical protein
MSLLDSSGVSTFDDLPIGQVGGDSQINLDYSLLASFIINSFFLLAFVTLFVITRTVAPKLYRKYVANLICFVLVNFVENLRSPSIILSGAPSNSSL